MAVWIFPTELVDLGERWHPRTAAPPLAKPLDESHNMPISRLSPLRVFAWLDLYSRRLNITVHRLIFCMGTRYAEYHTAPDPTLPRCDIPAPLHRNHLESRLEHVDQDEDFCKIASIIFSWRCDRYFFVKLVYLMNLHAEILEVGSFSW